MRGAWFPVSLIRSFRPAIPIPGQEPLLQPRGGATPVRMELLRLGHKDNHAATPVLTSLPGQADLPKPCLLAAGSVDTGTVGAPGRSPCSGCCWRLERDARTYLIAPL